MCLLCGLVLAIVLAAGAPAPVLADPAPMQAVEVSSRPISRFHIGRDESRFGPLEFVGGLEMTAPARAFGGISSMRFLAPGSDFMAVTDTGMWLFGRIARDADGRPSGLEQVRMQHMADATGNAILDKWEVDAEGLAVRDGEAVVGFERRHRISRFRIAPQGMQAATGTIDFLVPAHELRQNRGFETLAYAPASGPLKGVLVAVTEKSLDRQGNIFAAVTDGPGKGIFTVRRHEGFDITDGAFLPDGDLLLLERSYTIMSGVGMRLRRIAGDSIGKGALVDGPVLLQADMAYQIDNMEALDVWRRGNGATMVSMMSDDNTSILQRNLYLEFVLHED
ncbi:hypothetical protein ABID37_001160 [Aquamicrobium terrae]|uniref:Phytase-like domain-containing protein n=1 Tax=Aquamicrobium terrae TaxID=1324945 RepID=A0ABV2MZE4_9HYPH